MSIHYSISDFKHNLSSFNFRYSCKDTNLLPSNGIILDSTNDISFDGNVQSTVKITSNGSFIKSCTNLLLTHYSISWLKYNFSNFCFLKNINESNIFSFII